jgi:dTDP-4-dehydrorhamnose 3,5-epimerase
MRFTETGLPGACVIDIEPRSDDRGFFARSYCRDEFAAHGLARCEAQCNISYNARAGTLRGMHWRAAASPEAKLVRVTRGAILDVIVDLRPASPTFLRHIAVELTADNRRALFVPELFAHGFQTLTDDTEVFYQMSEVYTPSFDRGARFDDPAFGIVWPHAVSAISDKDLAWEAFAR